MPEEDSHEPELQPTPGPLVDAPAASPAPQGAEEPASGWYEAYADYSRNLRTWFLAYGVGGPVLFLSSETAWKALSASGAGTDLAWPFLAGVALQVLLAAFNKAAMWVLYYGAMTPAFRSGRCHHLAERFSAWFWIDLVVDVATLILFTSGTLAVMRALGAGPRAA